MADKKADTSKDAKKDAKEDDKKKDEEKKEPNDKFYGKYAFEFNRKIVYLLWCCCV